MERHIDELTEKARAHTVYANEQGTDFVVKSGSSGELYRVRMHENGATYLCTCAWTDNHPGSECSHTLAVRMSL